MDEMPARPSEDSCQALTGGTLARLGTFGVTMLPLAGAQSEIRGQFFGMPWAIPNLLFHDKPVPLSNMRSHGA